MTILKKTIAASLTLMMCVSYTPVMAASLNYKKVTLAVGKTKSLKIKGAKSVKWSVAKKTIATVSSKGVVKARKKGSTKVYGKVGKKTYTCFVTVVNVPKLSSSKVTLKVGATKTLKVLYNTKKVKWSSSKKSVATVSSKGKVSAVKAGSATIKAKVGSKTYSCKVTVPKMTLTKTSIMINKGSSYDLNVNNCKATATWSSSNKAIATVKSGGIIKGINAGSTTISAKVKTTTLKAKVTVKNVATSTSSKSASTSNYTTTRTTYTEGVVGQCIKASVMLGSSGTYTTSDKSIALVSKSGLVMPLKAGTVQISNTAVNKSMTITITDPGSVECGIDISYHNGNVDLTKVKAAGADFVIIRGGNTLKKLSTTNSDGIDLNLKTNIDKAQAAGLKYGIYWYMNSSDNKGLMTTAEADAQAAMLATYLKSYQTSYFKLPIYLDLEEQSALITGSTTSAKASYLQSLCEHFSSTLATYGYTDVGIYSSTSWYKSYLQSSYFVNSFSSRWLAHYGYNSVVGTSLANYTSVPSYTYNGVLYYPDLWQTGSDFSIDGVSGYVDMNYKYR